MGAGQSSGGGGVPAQEVKKSYYELLGVTRQATEEEIKKAYRRKALELHPDRNFGNEEAATKTFAEVQAAHEVLSDPQERAWYDSHESAVLRGDDVGDEEGVPTYENVRVTTADDLARMVRKFNSNVDFTDAPSGFFGYLREMFEQLAKEEEIAGIWEDVDVPEYPSFGHKDDAYDDVVKRFYAAWSSFSTVKAFAWKDKYRLSEAPDRWYRRRMEQENKKFRQDGVREFNDAVRSLVAFVRKRDPRYVPSTQTEEERQKILRDAAAAQAVRARAANEAKLNAEVPEWTKTREPVDDELEGNFDEEEVVEHVFECVACNKVFKSENQWEAHEKSKKHQKAVYALQKKMRKENAHLDLDVNGSGATSGAVTPDEEELKVHEVGPNDVVEEETHVESHVPDVEVETGADDQIDDEVPAENEEDGIGINHDDETNDTDKTPGNATPSEESEESEEDDDDYASPETITARMESASLGDTANSSSIAPFAGEESAAEQPAGPKLGKAAQKRAKKAAAAAAVINEEQSEAGHRCAGCDAAFPSKSRLFRHLKDNPKHAALKSAGGEAGKGKKGKAKR